MPSITERINADGKSVWLAQVRVRGAPKWSKCFQNRDEAIRDARNKEEEARSAVRRRRVPDLSGFNRSLMRDALLLYADANAKSLTACKKATIRKLSTLVGDVPMEQIDADYAKAHEEKLLGMHSKRRKPYGTGSVAQHITMMAMAYRWRAKEFNVQVFRSPFWGYKYPEPQSRDRRLARWEELAILRAMARKQRGRRHYWRLLFRLALETGARQAELVEAPWCEFDLNARVWNIPKHRTKARKARWVVLTKRALRIMRCLEKLRRKGEDLVFAGWKAHSVSAHFGDIVIEAGVGDFHFHDLRHEAISRMITRKREVQIFEVMRMVGHRSMKMLLVYANLRPEDLVRRMN